MIPPIATDSVSLRAPPERFAPARAVPVST
jgi:hypothetical protein